MDVITKDVRALAKKELAAAQLAGRQGAGLWNGACTSGKERRENGMILARDDIEKAVSWWAGKLLDHQPHSNGDDSFTSVTACFLADMAQQDITLDQVNAFKAALTKSIEEYAKSIPAFGFSIGSDYGPCKMLADAADEAGISRANFPFKTTMFFTEKEGILVRDGYGALPVRIC